MFKKKNRYYSNSNWYVKNIKKGKKCENDLKKTKETFFYDENGRTIKKIITLEDYIINKINKPNIKES